MTDWNIYEKQVVINTRKIIGLLDKYQAKATFFVLGKVAKRQPDLVHDIYKAGHEIASHGYSHQPISELGKIGFEKDNKRAFCPLVVIHFIFAHQRCPLSTRRSPINV